MNPTYASRTSWNLPLAFVRSGYVNGDSGSAKLIGNEGFIRSRTVKSTIGAYYLYFNPTEVYPTSSSSFYGYWSGRPLRCLYPGSA